MYKKLNLTDDSLKYYNIQNVMNVEKQTRFDEVAQRQWHTLVESGYTKRENKLVFQVTFAILATAL